MLNIAWGITGDESNTQDICQETFLKLHEAWVSGQSIDYPKAWLARVAVNAALDTRRHLSRHVRLEDVDEPRYTPGTIADIDRALLLDQIHRRIPELPERQREGFILRHFESLPFKEIARLVGTTPLAARSASFQALQKMREWLTESGPKTDSQPQENRT